MVYQDSPGQGSWILPCHHECNSSQVNCRKLGDFSLAMESLSCKVCFARDGEPNPSSSQDSSSSLVRLSGLLLPGSSGLLSPLRRMDNGESSSVKPDSAPVLLFASSILSSSPSLAENCNFWRTGLIFGDLPCLRGPKLIFPGKCSVYVKRTNLKNTQRKLCKSIKTSPNGWKIRQSLCNVNLDKHI